VPFQRVGASGTTKGQDRPVSDFNFGQRWNTNFVQKGTVRAAQIVQVDGICVTRDNETTQATNNEAPRTTKGTRKTEKEKQKKRNRKIKRLHSIAAFFSPRTHFLSSFLPFFLSPLHHLPFGPCTNALCTREMDK